MGKLCPKDFSGVYRWKDMTCCRHAMVLLASLLKTTCFAWQSLIFNNFVWTSMFVKVLEY